MAKHYYRYNYDYDAEGNRIDLEGTSKIENTDYNARKAFNDHYYWARLNSEANNWAEAYRQLGKSFHYLQDINAPHHATLKTNEATNGGHKKYEGWVNQNFYSSYWATSAAGSYDFMINSSFLTISNNFSKLAHDSYDACVNYNIDSRKAQAATGQNLTRAQRGVAGILYRFLRDTGREY